MPPFFVYVAMDLCFCSPVSPAQARDMRSHSSALSVVGRNDPFSSPSPFSLLLAGGALARKTRNVSCAKAPPAKRNEKGDGDENGNDQLRERKESLGARLRSVVNIHSASRWYLVNKPLSAAGISEDNAQG